VSEKREKPVLASGDALGDGICGWAYQLDALGDSFDFDKVILFALNFDLRGLRIDRTVTVAHSPVLATRSSTLRQIASLGQYNNLRIRHSKVLLFRSANLSDIQVLSAADKLELVKD
jgi:hypothetical protein